MCGTPLRASSNRCIVENPSGSESWYEYETARVRRRPSTTVDRRAARVCESLLLRWTACRYVFWNAHETEKSQVGNASWAGRANLEAFIAAAAARGLWMAVRIGPYICGEYYFGGIPVWMRESGAECFRCSDAVWEREAARWVGVVVDKIRPQLASARCRAPNRQSAPAAVIWGQVCSAPSAP